MILRNRHGQQSVRELRNRSLEVPTTVTSFSSSSTAPAT